MPEDTGARLIAVAGQAFAEHGVQTSLRDIARRAGVGIGTLYRHFPDRDALLTAVFQDRLNALREHAEDLRSADLPGPALLTWLTGLAAESAISRGLPSSILAAMQDETSPLHAACTTMTAAASALLSRARNAGAVATEVTITDLFALTAGIATAAEYVPGDPDLAQRLLTLCANGFLVR